jgi:predicted nuclease of predicted toxin-antitoxin system
VWLLDANLDIRVARILQELGIQSRTSESLGWKALSNGELVSAAVAAGYSCMLTRDGLFAESAARALRQFPDFAVVVIRLPQQKWPAYGDAFRHAWNTEPIIPSRGQAIRWP